MLPQHTPDRRLHSPLRTRFHRPIPMAIAMLFFAAFASIGFLTPAQAEEPLNITGPVTDPTDVLGDRTADVEAALKAYADDTGYQLFVVFVPTFDGMAGVDWADETAARSNIGTADLLLAVATDERSYGLSVDNNHPLSDDDIERVERDFILPELRDSNWADAAIQAAEGLTEAAEDADLPWGWIAGGGTAAVGVGAFAVHRLRKRYASTHVVRDEHGNPLDPLSALSAEELDQKRGAALVEVDDALKSSQQELSFAEAQFGKEVTKEFAQALVEARGLAERAFALQQRLDDSEPESEADHRRLSIDCIHLCDQADDLLDQHVAKFNELRNMQERAPEALADMSARADEVIARLPSARAQLETLAANHSATDLASISDNADQAEQLIAQAKQQCEQGQQAVAAGDRATAVVRAKAAEAAVGQATTLLNAIGRADADIKAAPAKITERIASLSQDVADADRLAPEDQSANQPIRTEAATAKKAIAYAQSGGHDPLAALDQLQTSEAKLDELLAPIRQAAAEAERARVALNESLTRAAARVKAVSEFIETRRGAVDAEARTRLSEASRHLSHAQQISTTDPQGALNALLKTNSLVDEAERLARTDVDRWNRSQQGSGDSMILGGIFGGGGGGGWGGGWGGSGGRSRSSSRSSSSRRRSGGSSRRRSSGSRGRRSRGGRF